MVPLRGFLNAGRRGHIQERYCNTQVAQQELGANGVHSFGQWRLLVHVKTVIAYRSHEQIHEIGGVEGQYCRNRQDPTFYKMHYFGFPAHPTGRAFDKMSYHPAKQGGVLFSLLNPRPARVSLSWTACILECALSCTEQCLRTLFYLIPKRSSRSASLAADPEKFSLTARRRSRFRRWGS
jgi:hypothetical protein